MSDPAVQMDLSLQVGKYDVQRALGKGATGTVYLARDTFTGGEVALSRDVQERRQKRLGSDLIGICELLEFLPTAA